MTMQRRLRPQSNTITRCRSCDAEALIPILDLGETPLADRLLTVEQLAQPEFFAPLKVMFCRDCTLVQLSETVSPEILFGEDYPYFSSVSPALQEHFSRGAQHLIETRALGTGSLVMEAASNDGYMLRHFVARRIDVLGIDPARKPVDAALSRGVNTLNTFFTRELAQQLLEEGKKADVFLANNVLAHVADLNGFVDGVTSLLKDDGIFVIEVPYLLDLVERCEFDTIYHQHLCYFSVMALDHLFRQHGLFLNNLEHSAIHGGSLRLFVEKHDKPCDSVRMQLERERQLNIDRSSYYLDFGSRVQNLVAKLTHALLQLKQAGNRIAGYGAAAKACTMMTVARIDSGILDYLVDLNEFKQGRYMSGNRLLIRNPNALLEDRPDYLLIFAWNFAEEIMKQQISYRALGGRFIIPAPELRVI